ncbi:MAG: twin-arginine translocase subunit TatB [Gammaproteobacteria bacterium]|nr:MAG: twin-arginine translocase subunit TatB [Gammaproteobacteria bacterium]
MFGIGFFELIILSLIGLIVLGPERLPRVANQLGNWLGQARRMTRVMKRQLEDELNFEKDLNIKPPNREPSSQPGYVPPRDDDDFSEAHEDGHAGTGVGNHELSEDDDDLADTTVDRGKKESRAEEIAETADAAAPEEEKAQKTL